MLGLRIWLRRPAPPAGPESFDAVIKVGAYNLPPGMPPTVAIAAIRRAVQAMPGAEAVSVEHHPADGANPINVFPANHNVRARERLRLQVARVVASAIDTVASTGAAVVPVAAAEPRGFSDAAAFRPILDDAGRDTSRTAPADAIVAGGALHGLADADLLARLLHHVTPADGDVAERAVARFGSFAAVLSAPEVELRALPGLGTHSIAAIKLLHAAALRLFRAAVMDQPHLDGSEALIAYLTAVLARESIEHFRILFLDAEGRLRADEAQARGTVNHTPVYPREVVRRALEVKATSIILVHNHPSGDPTPSRDDLDMTAMIETAAAAVGITVRDHIIVGNGRWLSFRQERLLGRVSNGER